VVCQPTPEALAAALRRVMDDRSVAERMGRAARTSVDPLNWSQAARQLTAID
jgi:glycosyltransferase involved in cell wall biosynthesis